MCIRFGVCRPFPIEDKWIAHRPSQTGLYFQPESLGCLMLHNGQDLQAIDLAITENLKPREEETNLIRADARGPG